MISLIIQSVKRRDWFQIIYVDLGKAGVTQSDVARACGRVPGAVRHWVQGGEPKDSEARIILSLYRKYCPLQYEEHISIFSL